MPPHHSFSHSPSDPHQHSPGWLHSSGLSKGPDQEEVCPEESQQRLVRSFVSWHYSPLSAGVTERVLLRKKRSRSLEDEKTSHFFADSSSSAQTRRIQFSPLTKQKPERKKNKKKTQESGECQLLHRSFPLCAHIYSKLVCNT